MVTQVIKRDGVVAQFDNNRIYLAIQKAANAASQTIENIEDLVSKITSKFEGKEQVTVEDIQNAVEHTLLVSKYKETAKKYIEYRHERDIFREGNGKLLKDAYDTWLKADISSFNWKADTVSFTKIPTDLNVEVKTADENIVTKRNLYTTRTPDCC